MAPVSHVPCSATRSASSIAPRTASSGPERRDRRRLTRCSSVPRQADLRFGSTLRPKPSSAPAAKVPAAGGARRSGAQFPERLSASAISAAELRAAASALRAQTSAPAAPPRASVCPAPTRISSLVGQTGDREGASGQARASCSRSGLRRSSSACTEGFGRPAAAVKEAQRRCYLRPHRVDTTMPQRGHSVRAGAAIDEAVHSGLSVQQLFDEMIRCNPTYGALLSEIRKGYDDFLRDHGAALPDDHLAFLAPDQESPSPAELDLEHEADMSFAEVVVDAARRSMLDLGDADTCSSSACEPSVHVLERENEALEALARKLRAEIADISPPARSKAFAADADESPLSARSSGSSDCGHFAAAPLGIAASRSRMSVRPSSVPVLDIRRARLSTAAS
eukprot:TRINITY_DN57267_c0_g1_i1.p1 TRINITY_DN57267_c0_g1~~TRINITY_DN57267_c0_g1_i1.p1  ORF type:complete len:394 (+),score=78.11 TRINITY_DN57267_c0_g1_i1:24-1205(+)